MFVFFKLQFLILEVMFFFFFFFFFQIRHIIHSLGVYQPVFRSSCNNMNNLNTSGGREAAVDQCALATCRKIELGISRNF